MGEQLIRCYKSHDETAFHTIEGIRELKLDFARYLKRR